jgi:hypothetical protein
MSFLCARQGLSRPASDRYSLLQLKPVERITYALRHRLVQVWLAQAQAPAPAPAPALADRLAPTARADRCREDDLAPAPDPDLAQALAGTLSSLP